MKPINWWAWGFTAACLLASLFEHVGLHPGATNTGLALLVFIFSCQCANVYFKFREAARRIRTASF